MATGPNGGPLAPMGHRWPCRPDLAAPDKCQAGNCLCNWHPANTCRPKLKAQKGVSRAEIIQRGRAKNEKTNVIYLFVQPFTVFIDGKYMMTRSISRFNFLPQSKANAKKRTNTRYSSWSLEAHFNFFKSFALKGSLHFSREKRIFYRFFTQVF